MNIELLTAQSICRSVERLVTSRGGFDLDASPLQRAICRVLDGSPLGELGAMPEVQRAFGGAMPQERPKEMAILAAIRSGKSLIAGATALKWSQTIDLAQLRPGEVARICIVSTSRDNAKVVYQHVAGSMQASPYLRTLLAEEPRNDVVLVRHPSGRHVEIMVVAGARAGSSLVARWLGGVVFDEFPRMNGEEDAVINWDDQRKAVLNRIRPGGGILDIGSPWAPFGPAYTMFVEHFGKPSRSLVVVKAPGYDMNPEWWTPERVAESKAEDPDAHITDCEANFSTPEESLFAGTEIDRSTRAEPLELPPLADHDYAAAMDPATRANAWSFVIGTREGPKKRIVLARQWIGSRADPLSSGEVLAQIGEECHRYGISYVETDQYYVDALDELARSPTYITRDGLVLPKRPVALVQPQLTEREKVELWLALRLRVSEGAVEFPPDPVFRADMQRVKRRATQTGVQIVLPRTSDGRHCDYAPATLLVLRRWLHDVEVPLPQPGSPAALMREQDAAKREAERRWGKRRRY